MTPSDPTRDPEELRDLRTELEQIMTDGLEVWQRQEEARAVRFNVWEGQSADGRKHAASMGEDPLPFEGASDARIPAVDSVIGDKVALAKQAIFRAQVQATPVEPSDAPKAASVTALLRWLRDCEMRAELETEVELSPNTSLATIPPSPSSRSTGARTSRSSAGNSRSTNLRSSTSPATPTPTTWPPTIPGWSPPCWPIFRISR